MRSGGFKGKVVAVAGRERIARFPVSGGAARPDSLGEQGEHVVKTIRLSAVILLAAACGDSSESVVGPSDSPPDAAVSGGGAFASDVAGSVLTRDASGGPSSSAPEVGPVDVRADARYSWSTRLYRELISDSLDRNQGWGRAYLLRDPASIRISVFRGDVDGRCAVGRTVRGRRDTTINYHRIISGAARRLIEDATGQPWRGRVYSTARAGLAEQIANDPGYVTVGFAAASGCPGSRALGCAQVGTRPGGIRIVLDSACRVLVGNASQFGKVFAHELGHALGFFHVSDTSWTMYGTLRDGGAGYSGREAQHMELGSRRAREGVEPHGHGIDAPAPRYGGAGVSIFDDGGVWVP